MRYKAHAFIKKKNIEYFFGKLSYSVQIET